MQTVINEPKNEIRYEKFWAIVTRDKDGKEGIVAYKTPIGWTTLATGSKKNLQSFVTFAQHVTPLTEQTMHVLEFTRVDSTALEDYTVTK